MRAIVTRMRRQFSYAHPAKRAGLILLLLAAFSVVGSSAWAYWTTHGTGTASATTGTLNPPTNVVAGNTPVSTTVHVSWTAPATGAAPTGYYVTPSGGSATSSTCGTVSSPAAATSCDYTAITTAGAFTYTVTAVVHSWTAISIASNSVTVVTDMTPPAVTINQAVGQADPTNSGTVAFTAAFSEPVTGFTNGDVTVGGTAGGTKTASISGTGPVYTVTISGATGNGTITASIGASTVLDLAANNNTASTSTDNTVTLDTTAPTVTLTSSPSSPNGTNSWFKSAVTWTPSASDLNGIASCQPFVTYSTPDSATASVTRTCTDNAGNVGTATMTFKYDATVPSGSVTTPAIGATVSGTTVSVASTNATDAAAGVASVQFQVNPAAGGSFATIGAADTTSPYAATWDTTTAVNGSYLLQTIVTDVAGNTFTSVSTNVTVTNAYTFVVSNPGSQIAGNPFGGLTLQLQTNGVNSTTFGGLAYTGSKAITLSGPSTSPSGTAPTYPSTVAFTNGIGTIGANAITLTTAQSTTLTATMTADGIAGTSGSVTVTRANVQLTLSCTSPAQKGSNQILTLGRPSVDIYGNAVTGQPVTVTVSATNVTANLSQSVTILSANLSQTFVETLTTANNVTTVVSTDAPSGYTAASSCSIAHIN